MGRSTARREAPAAPALRDLILAAWATNNRVTVFLVENLPAPLWEASVPGAPRRTIRMIAGHMHNARCMWVKTIGKEHGIRVPDSIERRTASRKEVVSALERSSRGIGSLLALGCDHGGTIPAPATYVWRKTGNFIETFIDNATAEGRTTVTAEGTTLGVFDNVYYRNSDEPTRRYQGRQFQGTYRPAARWTVSAA